MGTLVDSLRRKGLELQLRHGTLQGIEILAGSADALRAIVMENFEKIVGELKQKVPYLNDADVLVIPMGCEPKYRWWAGGQSIDETLRELKVGREVWKRYSAEPYEPDG